MARQRGPELPAGVLFATHDRRGRLVHLRESGWEHIIEGHPAMDGFELAVKRAVENAETIRRGRHEGREVLYGRNLGPARWLAVVVAYPETSPGYIVTAYPTSKLPREENRER